MNKIEGNKLIAEFMGFRRQNDNEDETDGTSFGRYKHWHLGERGHFNDSDLLYHWSWDWLMPVVDKIETIGYDTGICVVLIKGEKLSEVIISPINKGDWKIEIHSRLSSSKIDLTWGSVTQFIQLYNQVI